MKLSASGTLDAGIQTNSPSTYIISCGLSTHPRIIQQQASTCRPYVHVLRLSLSILHARSNLPHDREMPRQKYTRGLIVGLTRKSHSNISPTSVLNFTVVKKCEILARFSTSVAFDALWLQNRATYRKSETYHWSDDDSSSLRLRNFASPSPNF